MSDEILKNLDWEVDLASLPRMTHGIAREDSTWPYHTLAKSVVELLMLDDQDVDHSVFTAAVERIMGEVSEADIIAYLIGMVSALMKSRDDTPQELARRVLEKEIT